MKAEQASCDEWFKASMYRELAYRISLWTFFTCVTFYLASSKEDFSFTKNLKETIEKSNVAINSIGIWVLVFMAIAWLTKDIETTNPPEWKDTLTGKLLSFFRKITGDILLWLCSTCNAMLFVTIASFMHALKNYPLPNLSNGLKAAYITLLLVSLESIMIFFYIITKKEGGLLVGNIKRRKRIITLHLLFILFVVYLINS